MRKICFLFSWVSLFFIFFAYAENIPSPQGWVNDFAGVISLDYKEKLNSLIGEIEQRTSTEIAVVTIASIAPYDEAGYARLLFDNWKPGKKGKDNGVLVLLAIKERRWRIETGYGIEGILPDSLCGEIGRNYMVPYFKEGKYAQGLYYGVSAIAKVISEDAKISISNLDVKSGKRGEEPPVFLYLFVLIFFFVWNLPWPFIFGLPFTLLFAFIFYSISPVLGILVIVGYLFSLIVRYNYWNKLPKYRRKDFFGPQTYGGTSWTGDYGGGGFGGGGFGGGGGGFGGGGGGGGGAGGGF